MTGPGHNRGPSLEPGEGWRRHCWMQARRALLPQLPLEVIRLRVARARAVGLDYRTYAGVRAGSGHDIVAFLFSSNALRLMRQTDPLPQDRASKLRTLSDCGRILFATPPLDAAALARRFERQGVRFEPAGAAPRFPARWREMRACVLGALAPGRLPADGVLLVGDTGFEREWAEAGRLAGYLSAARYFPDARG